MENSNATLPEVPLTPMSQFVNQRITFDRNQNTFQLSIRIVTSKRIPGRVLGWSNPGK
jgi:hypothetical protein